MTTITPAGWVWFQGKDTVGIILFHDTSSNKIKARIGLAKGDIDYSTQMIREFGSDFPTKEAISLIETKGVWASMYPQRFNFIERHVVNATA